MTSPRWPFLLATLAIALGAALVTWVVMGMPNPNIGNATLKKFNIREFALLLTVVGTIAFSVFARYLVHKAIFSAVRKVWVTIKSNATGTPMATQPIPKAPAAIGQTFAVLIATLSFANPMWDMILRKTHLEAVPLLSLLPIAVFARWAWQRHARSLKSY